MEFDFVYKEKMKKLFDDNEVYYTPNVKGVYVYPLDFIWVNLSALQFKKVEPVTIAEVCTCLQHEYLHKSIRHIRKELGSDMLKPEDEYEEKIIPKITNEVPFDT